MAIKKQYQELFDFINSNKQKKISSVYDELVQLMSASTRMEATFKKDSDGNITHIYCYYHKKWEDLSVHEFGTKSKSTTGYNTMCKVGVNQWSKQQREAKRAKELMLEQVASGEVRAEDIQTRLAEIEQERTTIVYPDNYIETEQF